MVPLALTYFFSRVSPPILRVRQRPPISTKAPLQVPAPQPFVPTKPLFVASPLIGTNASSPSSYGFVDAITATTTNPSQGSQSPSQEWGLGGMDLDHDTSWIAALLSASTDDLQAVNTDLPPPGWPSNAPASPSE